jgi:RND superfamily putative drug exporter
MFQALGRLAHRHFRLVLAFGAAFTFISALLGTQLFSHLSDGGYNNPASESARVAEELDAHFGGAQASLVVLLTARPGETVDSPSFVKDAAAVWAKVSAVPGVAEVTSYASTGAEQLVASDRQITYGAVRFSPGVDPRVEVHLIRQTLQGGPLAALLGGEPAVRADVLDQVERDLKSAELLTLPVTAILLLLVFGSVAAAALPLAMGGMAILGAFFFLRLLTLVAPVSVFALNVVTMLGLGLAIDYSLFIVSRFREELAQGSDVAAALGKTLATAGHTVFFSGLTVALSLLSLLLFPQMVLWSMGLAGALGVLVAMASSLTVLPSLLAWLGPRVNAWAINARARPRAVEAPEEHGFWYRLSHVVMRHPVTVLLLTLVPLLVLGSPFLGVRFSMPDERNVPKGLESRVVAERIRQSFPDDLLEPMQLVVRFDAQEAASKEALDALYDYVQELKKVPGVTRVVSLASLDPRIDSKPALHRFLRMVASGNLPEGQKALDHFAHGRETWAQIYFQGNPRSDEARDLVARVRAVPPPAGAQVKVGGVSAELVDLLRDMKARLPWGLAVVVVTIMALLFAMLGSVVVPIKAVLLNFLSLTVSFGALVWVFQAGHWARALGAEKLGAIDALEPVLVFVIAFGLSMDYEVFLLGRIKESFDQTGDNRNSVALGIQRTGGLITSAALLLAVVIVGFALGKVLSLKQVGMGLFLAVLVDATLVRSLLVPATMTLLGRLNWWAPRPLRTLHERVFGHRS